MRRIPAEIHTANILVPLGLTWLANWFCFIPSTLGTSPRAFSLLLFQPGFRGRPDGRDIRVDFQGCLPFARHFNMDRFAGIPRFLGIRKADLRLNRAIDGEERVVKDEL